MLYLTKILKTSWAIGVTQVKTKKKFLFDKNILKFIELFVV